jgi:hypothetical protein
MKYFIIVLVLLTAASVFAFWFFFMNIYETELKTEISNPDRTNLKLTVIPLNGFGGKAWFRHLRSELKIKTGADLIDIIKINENDSVFEVKARSGCSGKLGIVVKSEYSLMPENREFLIDLGKF